MRLLIVILIVFTFACTSQSATDTLTPSETNTHTATDTLVPSETASSTNTPTETPTLTPSPTQTPTETNTPTPSKTSTPTPTNSPTPFNPQPQGTIVTTESEFLKCIAIPNCTAIVVGRITLTKRTTVKARGVTIIGFGSTALLTNSVSNVYAVLEVVDTRDVTIRNIRIRRTPNVAKASTGDALQCVRVVRCRIDHVSVAWAVDGSIDLNTCTDCSITNSIIAEPLRNSTHSEGSHSMGSLIDSSIGVLFQGNLLVSVKERNPRVISSQNVTIRDNWVYNFGSHPTVISGDRGVSSVNYLENRLIPGLDSPAITYGVAVTNPLSSVGVYADKKAVREGDWRYVVVLPFGDVGDAVSFDIETVGAWPRDSTDSRLVECTISRDCVIRDTVP